MRVHVDGKALNEALKMAASVAPKKASVAALTQVTVEALDGGVVIGATDLGQWVHARCAASVLQSGRLAVELASLRAAVKGARGPVSISIGPDPGADVDAPHALRVQSGGVDAWIRLCDLSDIPMRPNVIDPGAGSDVDAVALRAALAGVAHAMSTDETRYNLTAVCIDAEGAAPLMVATDGHRLAVQPAPVGLQPDAKTTLLPAAAVGTLLAMLNREEKAKRGATVRCAFATLLWARFETAGASLDVRCTDGAYPNWHKVLPKGGQTATVDRAALRGLLGCLMPSAAPRSKALRIRANDVLQVETCGPDSQRAAGQVPCVWASDIPGDVVLGVNGRYLADALASLDGPDLVLSLGDELGPISLRGADPEALRIVMPMRL